MAKIRQFMLDIYWDTDTMKYSFQTQGVPHLPADIVRRMLTSIVEQTENERCETMGDYYNPKKA